MSGAGAALAGIGVAGTAAMVALGALLPLALLPLPLALGVGYGVVRRFAPAVARIQLGLERALDFLEQGWRAAAATAPRPELRDSGIAGG